MSEEKKVKLEIKMTEQQRDYLKQFAKAWDAESPRVRYSIVVVGSERTIYIDSGYDNGSTIRLVEHSDYESYRFDNMDELRKHIEEDYKNDEDDCGYYDDEKIDNIIGEVENLRNYDDEHITIDYCDCTTIFEPQAYFLTKEQAERYLEYQGHNVKNPRIDTVSVGYQNQGDLPYLIYLLKAMGDKLNEQ